MYILDSFNYPLYPSQRTWGVWSNPDRLRVLDEWIGGKHWGKPLYLIAKTW